MSYFAKPYFIPYDEWFDNDLEKSKINTEDRKIKVIPSIHEFFYRQSNNKFGASENNLKLDIENKSKQLLTNNYDEDFSGNYLLPNKEKYEFIQNSSKSKFKFRISHKLFSRLSIMSFLVIFGLSIFFLSQSNEEESNTLNNILEIQKEL